ncbi:exosortase/archaeosortase family protein [Tichowtungia aerotolerans]|uniref:Exosortase n=1 Tax=Tichowtungia aerotolerans TaxID=2697043 RepID=A0A6P1MGJ2_9BACT|nr:exosortase/archaeosortase family protein [Tichowtungia aerotolerans]QHI70205.1 exosortase [Tichowtungia aerotolerans]
MQNQTNIKVWSERWRLGALESQELIRIGLVSVMIGLLFMLFHMLGNTVENVNSRSAFTWMVARWGDTISFGADYSHGYFIPFVSLAVLWYRRKEIFSVETWVDWRGLVVVIGALFMHWLGAKMQQTRLSLMSLVLLTWGIPFYLFGWRIAKNLIFPCSYLIFCIPLNFLDVIAFPLRIFSTKIAVGMLNGFGIEAVRSGTAILIPSMPTGMDVADPCSGLRSLLAMTALTAVYAYFTQKTFIKKWILFLSSIPLAVIGNIARIVTIAFVSEALGPKPALGLYHDYSGYILFAAAITAMVIFGGLLNMGFKEMLKKWKFVR